MSAYFSALASVSGTLVALLFVAVQYRHQLWSVDPVRRRLAQTTLLEFLTPTVVSLSMLSPNVDLLTPLQAFAGRFGWKLPGWWSVQALHHIVMWQLAGCLFSVVGLVSAVWYVAVCVTHFRMMWGGGHALRLPFVFSPLALLEYGPLGLAAFTGYQDVIVVILLWLVVSGSIESWWFFTEVANPGEFNKVVKLPDVQVLGEAIQDQGAYDTQERLPQT